MTSLLMQQFHSAAAVSARLTAGLSFSGYLLVENPLLFLLLSVSILKAKQVLLLVAL